MHTFKGLRQIVKVADLREAMESAFALAGNALEAFDKGDDNAWESFRWFDAQAREIEFEIEQRFAVQKDWGQNREI